MLQSVTICNGLHIKVKTITNIMTTFNATLADLGAGMGTFLTSIGDPTANFILLLAIIGGVVAIFMAIATVIAKAIQKGVK